MRVTAALDKPGGPLDSLAETDISTGHAQKLAAGLIVLNNLEAKAHGIDGARKNRLSP